MSDQNTKRARTRVAQTAPDGATPARSSVTLLRTLTLAGKPHAVGEVVAVDAHTAAWLRHVGVIAPLATSATDTRNKQPAQPQE